MWHELSSFLLAWAITALSLAASNIFAGMKFDDTPSFIVSALLLGLAKAVVKPLLIELTPLLTLLVARLVKGSGRRASGPPSSPASSSPS